MKFKTDRINKEYGELHSKNYPLYSILSALDDYCRHEFNKDIELTSIFRTEEENKAAHAATEIHCFWEAADVSIRDFNHYQQTMMLQFCNQYTYYGSPGHRVAMIHSVPGGAEHLHVQQVIRS